MKAVTWSLSDSTLVQFLAFYGMNPHTDIKAVGRGTGTITATSGAKSGSKTFTIH